MAYIVEQFAGDKGIQLANEEVIRPFSFGTNWSVIRIGIRMAVNAYSALSAIDFRLGICTGSVASYGSPVDALWYPLWQQAATLTYAGSPPTQSQESSLGTVGYQRVGTTSSNIGSATVLRPVCSSNPTVLRSLWFVQITKGTVGAAAFGMDSIFRRSDGGFSTTDATRGDFLAYMETSGTPATMFALSVATTGLPLRTAKDWNAMFVAWPRSTPSLCIYDMSVVRFS